MMKGPVYAISSLLCVTLFLGCLSNFYIDHTADDDLIWDATISFKDPIIQERDANGTTVWDVELVVQRGDSDFELMKWEDVLVGCFYPNGSVKVPYTTPRPDSENYSEEIEIWYIDNPGRYSYPEDMEIGEKIKITSLDKDCEGIEIRVWAYDHIFGRKILPSQFSNN